MEQVYNDGGRSKYFKAANVGDCVTRAIAIATSRDHKEVYKEIGRILGYTPRNGIYGKDTQKLMKHFGGRWVPCMGIGTGCKVHLKEDELPKGTIIVNVSHHLSCVIDGVINDTYNPARNETRCVYGYWIFQEPKMNTELEGWLIRTRCDRLLKFQQHKPERMPQTFEGWSDSNGGWRFDIWHKLLPELKYEDEPRKVKMTIETI